ncbi:MAG: hypothetical protein LBP63_10995 [Prevotellaceae bacterium]|jgi:hypothetical protein|nr:hypothetical protein [Prevotellaceae bacterium]
MMIQKLKTVESYFFTLLDWLTPSFGCYTLRVLNDEPNTCRVASVSEANPNYLFIHYY